MIDKETLEKLLAQTSNLNLDEAFEAWEINSNDLVEITNDYTIAVMSLNPMLVLLPQRFIEQIPISFMVGFTMGYKTRLEVELNASDS